MALVGRDQGVRDDEVGAEASGAKPDPPQKKTGIAGLIDTVLAFRPVRVFFHYSNDNGPLIASGMTYQAIFALFAGLWFGFSVAGFVIKGNTDLQNTVFSTLNNFIPSLISYDPDGSLPGTAVPGAIKASVLLDTSALSWSGALSLIGVLFTAVGFLGTLRTAIRIMFDLPNPTTNFLVLKLKDLGLTIAFGAVVLLTAVISLVSNTALGVVLSLLGLHDATALQEFATRAVTFVVLAVIDTAILMGAFRILSGIRIPFRRLLVGAVIGGVALTVLQTIGTSLLHGASSNPVIGAFATLIGVLLYFNFVCQAILLSASWVDVGMEDAGIDPHSFTPQRRELARAEQIEEARRLVAEANQEALQQRVQEAGGLVRWKRARDLQREIRAEEKRRQGVPTVAEFSEAQRETGDVDPDARQVEKAVD
jgi:membrane protein